MISAIVPAAGLSTRMESQNKLLLLFNGKTLVESTVDTLIGSGIGEIIVVVGHQKELVKAALLRKEVVIVENPDYREGMASSIRAGVSVLAAVDRRAEEPAVRVAQPAELAAER